MKTRQGDSLFLKVDVGGETVRVFGRPEELAERLVKVGKGHNGYKNIEEFLPATAGRPEA